MDQILCERLVGKSTVDHGLDDSHVDAMMECVSATLKELTIYSNLNNIIKEHRDYVLGR